MSDSNTNERTLVQLGLATLARELGAQEGDVVQIDSDGEATIAAGGEAGGGSSAFALTGPITVTAADWDDDDAFFVVPATLPDLPVFLLGGFIEIVEEFDGDITVISLWFGDPAGPSQGVGNDVPNGAPNVSHGYVPFMGQSGATPFGQIGAGGGNGVAPVLVTDATKQVIINADGSGVTAGSCRVWLVWATPTAP